MSSGTKSILNNLDRGIAAARKEKEKIIQEREKAKRERRRPKK